MGNYCYKLKEKPTLRRGHRLNLRHAKQVFLRRWHLLSLRRVKIIQVAGVPESTMNKDTGTSTAHSMCTWWSEWTGKVWVLLGYGATESDGNQVTEGLVRPDSCNNNNNRSWYLLSICYVAGTMLSTSSVISFSSELYNPHFINEGTEG